MIPNFRAAAERLVECLRDVEPGFDYNRDSVANLDEIIETNRGTCRSEQQVRSVVISHGAFLGECLIEACGGKWRFIAEVGQWGVHFGDDLGIAFPFAKVYKAVVRGSDDSILAFYDAAVAFVRAGGRLESLNEGGIEVILGPPV